MSNEVSARPGLIVMAAMSENRCIGRNDRLPWKLPDEWKYFKETTQGRPFLIGRKSYKSPDGLYSDYRNVVVSTRDDLELPEQPAEQARSLDEALERLSDEEEVFVLGGARIFEQLLPRADRLYVTIVHAVVEGDAFFPEVRWDDWREVYTKYHPDDERHAHAFTMKRYVRA